MTLFSSQSKKRHGATLAGIFSMALSSVLLLCGAGLTPTGNVQKSDINANGFSLTNAATLSATNVVANGVSIIDAGGKISWAVEPDTFSPYDYGAKPDGRIVTDVSATSGSGVITSSSAAFTSGDVGKVFVLYYGAQQQRTTGTTTSGAKTITGLSSTTGIVPGMIVAAPGIPLGDTVSTVDSGSQVTMTANATASATVPVDFAPVYLITTIASFQSATQVTLAANSTLTESSARAIYGTDSTAGIQGAVNACAASTHGTGTVKFRSGMYIVAGALQNPTIQNSVITLPALATSTPLTAMAFKGAPLAQAGPNGFLSYGATTNGTVIFCPTAGSGTVSSIISGNASNGTSHFGGFTPLNFYVEDITFETPAGSTLGAAINEFNGGGFILHHVAYQPDFTDVSHFLRPSTAFTAFIFPNANNSSWASADNVSIIGAGTGFKTGSHTYISNSVVGNSLHAVDADATDLCLTNNHFVSCINNLRNVYGGNVTLACTGLELEDEASGNFKLASDLDNTSSGFAGRFDYINFSGANPLTFSSNNAVTYLHVICEDNGTSYSSHPARFLADAYTTTTALLPAYQTSTASGNGSFTGSTFLDQSGTEQGTLAYSEQFGQLILTGRNSTNLQLLAPGGTIALGSFSGLLKGTSGVVSVATAGTDYIAPTASGLTTISVTGGTSGATPYSMLSVKDTASANDIKIGVTNSGSYYPAIWLNQSAPTVINYAFLGVSGTGNYINAPSGQVLGLRNNNNDIATITATGLGIGTTSPSYPLDVTGQARITGAVQLGTVQITSGSNKLAGTVTLSSGSGTISSTSIDANTVIMFSLKTSSGTPSKAQPLAAVSSGSATVTGDSSSDNSTYNWVAMKVN